MTLSTQVSEKTVHQSKRIKMTRIRTRCD